MFAFVSGVLFTAHVASQRKVNHNINPVVPWLLRFLNRVKDFVMPVRPDYFSALPIALI